MKLYLSCHQNITKAHQVVTLLSSCGQADIQLSPIKCHLLPCCQIAVSNSNIGMSNFHFLSWNLPPKQESLAIVSKGSHPEGKVQFFWTLFKRPLTPPPFYLNICPILQGVFFKTRFWALKMVVIMYLFHPQISPSMPQKSLFMQISCC